MTIKTNYVTSGMGKVVPHRQLRSLSRGVNVFKKS